MILTFQMHFPAVEEARHYISVTIPNNANVRDVASIKLIDFSYLKRRMQKQVFPPNHPFSFG